MNDETFGGFTNQSDRNERYLRYTDSDQPINSNDEVSVKGDRELKLYIIAGIHPDFDEYLVLRETKSGMVFLQSQRVVHYTNVLKVLVIAADKEAA